MIAWKKGEGPAVAGELREDAGIEHGHERWRRPRRHPPCSSWFSTRTLSQGRGTKNNSAIRPLRATTYSRNGPSRWSFGGPWFARV